MNSVNTYVFSRPESRVRGILSDIDSYVVFYVLDLVIFESMY